MQSSLLIDSSAISEQGYICSTFVQYMPDADAKNPTTHDGSDKFERALDKIAIAYHRLSAAWKPMGTEHPNFGRYSVLAAEIFSGQKKPFDDVVAIQLAAMAVNHKFGGRYDDYVIGRADEIIEQSLRSIMACPGPDALKLDFLARATFRASLALGVEAPLSHKMHREFMNVMRQIASQEDVSSFVLSMLRFSDRAVGHPVPAQLIEDAYEKAKPGLGDFQHAAIDLAIGHMRNPEGKSLLQVMPTTAQIMERPSSMNPVSIMLAVTGIEPLMKMNQTIMANCMRAMPGILENMTTSMTAAIQSSFAWFPFAQPATTSAPKPKPVASREPKIMLKAPKAIM